METIELTPSKQGYIDMLKMIINRSSNTDDVVWAKAELVKLTTEV